MTNVRPETMKLLGESKGSIFFFFRYVSSSNGKKSKRKQTGLHQTEKLLHSQRNQQSEKQPMEGNKYF